MPRISKTGEVQLMAEGYARVLGITASTMRGRRFRGHESVITSADNRYTVDEVLASGLSQDEKDRLVEMLREFADELAQQADMVRRLADDTEEPSLF